MERTRHMVEIADDSWSKLERLAHRLGNAQYLYKGRPRYGKLIELAIEKLEDSTMEWTVEEVWVDGKGSDVTDELKDILHESATSEAEKDWWPVNSHLAPIQAPPSMDMDLYGNAYIGVDTGFPIKASSISFKISADDTSAKQLEKLSETLKDLNKGIGASTKSAQDLAKKLDLTNPYVTYDVKHPDYIEIHATLSQALSAPEQLILRKFAEAEFAKYSNDTEAYAVNASIKNVPWNKLFIFASYTDPSKLTESLSDVAFFVRHRVQEWLLKGNFIGPLPKAVDITEKKPNPVTVATDPNITAYAKVSANSFENGSTVVMLSCELTQAMSANQQSELRNYIWQSAKKYIKQPTGIYPLDECYMKNVPWNKLYIDFTYQPETTLITTLHVVAHKLRMTLENWLLNRNLIGPLPQAVNIAEMKPSTANYVSGGHKFEKAIDKNGTMQTYHEYNFLVHLDTWSGANSFYTYKSIISEHITTRLLVAHGYASSNIAGHAQVLWDNNLGGKIRITASVIRNQHKLGIGDGTVKNFIDEITEYLVKYAKMAQKPLS